MVAKKTVQIYNLTRKTMLADKAKYADSFFSRLVGLLGEKSLSEGYGIAIKPCNMVHTLGMRFEIDVLFLSSQKEVIYMIDNMKPYKISPFIKKSVMVVELPAGTIQKNKTLK